MATTFTTAIYLQVFADPTKRSWFNLFCVMNYDRSGKVTYVELAKFLRKNIHISHEDLPEAKLLSVWMANPTPNPEHPDPNPDPSPLTLNKSPNPNP